MKFKELYNLFSKLFCLRTWSTNFCCIFTTLCSFNKSVFTETSELWHHSIRKGWVWVSCTISPISLATMTEWVSSSPTFASSAFWIGLTFAIFLVPRMSRNIANVEEFASTACSLLMPSLIGWAVLCWAVAWISLEVCCRGKIRKLLA